jgi:putative cell wall-binding protein
MKMSRSIRRALVALPVAAAVVAAPAVTATAAPPPPAPAAKDDCVYSGGGWICIKPGLPQKKEGEVNRIAGANRYGTSAAVAATWQDGAEVAYLVSGVNFPDALAAAAAAGDAGAPVLLTAPGKLPNETRQALVELGASRVVIVGGEVSVSKTVADAVAALPAVTAVERVAGSDRYATAAKVAERVQDADVVYLASGADYPDALAGAALAGHDGAPLLLTRPNALPSATAAQLRRLAPAEVVVLGGTVAVNDTVAQAAAAAADGSYRRIAGANRFETATKIAEEFRFASRALLASGQDFPDALVGAALAGRDGAPVLLTSASTLPAATAGYLNKAVVNKVDVLGGAVSVSEKVLAAVRSIIGDLPGTDPVPGD